MFYKILVPLDGTERSHDALALPRKLAEQSHASLLLLYVESHTPLDQWSIKDNREVSGRRNVMKLAEELRAQGIDAHAVIEYDAPVAGILSAIRDENSDLVVIAPHHRHFLEALRHPSVTLRLLSQATTPLLIWPEDTTNDATDAQQTAAAPLNSAGSVVIVPLDGSDFAEQALPFATAFANEYQRPLLLVHVVPRLTSLAADAEAVRYELNAQRAEELEARQYLRSLRHELIRTSGVSVQTMLLSGEPAHELLALAQTRPDSLLVMTSHGRSGLARLFVGSVAATLVKQTPIPLLIVPPSDRLQTPLLSEKGQERAISKM